MSRQNVPCLRVNGWVCYREPIGKARVPDIFKQAMSERPDEQLDEEIRGLQGQIEASKKRNRQRSLQHNEAARRTILLRRFPTSGRGLYRVGHERKTIERINT